MTSLLVGVIVALVGLSGISIIMWRVTDKQRADLEKELDNAVKNNKELIEHLSKLNEELRIKNKNRKNADEKVNDLHNGKLSADDILPK